MHFRKCLISANPYDIYTKIMRVLITLLINLPLARNISVATCYWAFPPRPFTPKTILEKDVRKTNFKFQKNGGDLTNTFLNDNLLILLGMYYIVLKISLMRLFRFWNFYYLFFIMPMKQRKSLTLWLSLPLLRTLTNIHTFPNPGQVELNFILTYHSHNQAKTLVM